jgi:hypothetical protein
MNLRVTRTWLLTQVSEPRSLLLVTVVEAVGSSSQLPRQAPSSLGSAPRRSRLLVAAAPRRTERRARSAPCRSCAATPSAELDQLLVAAAPRHQARSSLSSLSQLRCDSPSCSPRRFVRSLKKKPSLPREFIDECGERNVALC